jgi:hypothetical protein
MTIAERIIIQLNLAMLLRRKIKLPIRIPQRENPTNSINKASLSFSQTKA